jgi:hypothetical protein
MSDNVSQNENFGQIELLHYHRIGESGYEDLFTVFTNNRLVGFPLYFPFYGRPRAHRKMSRLTSIGRMSALLAPFGVVCRWKSGSKLPQAKRFA